MDFEAIKKAAEGYKPAMVKFLRDMIAIPSESCEEKGVVHRIAEEMKALGYDKVEFDKLGNVIGWMGEGDKIIALDSHVDTVGIGNRDNWEADPYQGYETDDIIYGRGGSDQEGGMASATYGARIMKDLGLIPAGYKIMVVGSVQEEDCDGMCWQSIVNEYFNGPEDARSKVEFVISTEPTDGGIYRGHRGRMEIRVDMHGVSCHGSAPERGDNAIHKMAEVIQNVRDLNENPADDSVEIKGLVKMLDPKYNPEHWEDARFLGRGTCTTSQIFYTSPSRCAVADSCAISIDRMLKGADIQGERGRKRPQVPEDRLPGPGIGQEPRHERGRVPADPQDPMAENVRPLDMEACFAEALRCMTCGSRSRIAYNDDCMTCFTCELRCPSGAIFVHPFKERFARTLDQVDVVKS